MKKEAKYKKIVNHVIDGINRGEFKLGDWIPSINEFRKKYASSRDTVFAGLSDLKARGIIDSKPGTGYFVASTKVETRKHIFLLFNEFNEFKEDLYNAFMGSIKKGDTVDLYFHNYNRKVFETLLTDAIGKYTTYVIMTGKFKGIEQLLSPIADKVYLLDHFESKLQGKYPSVAQNFEKDTYEALSSGLEHILKYKRILMVQSHEKEPLERYDGLQRFCLQFGLEHQYLNRIADEKIKVGDLYVLVDDRDMVKLIKQSELQKIKLGSEFGIISYNDTPLKEILRGGITTLSTDFRKMGDTMARLIYQNGIETIENPWKLTLRKSI
ncbi:GntR family transcriptional regulator [Echinicola marina]|uniref:GntR family transcriptional regulator n=1 Tax=Echinicola marina TaxID=2859768 RepID=UPI001CF702E5|nr:GntR family transcriptional regulator [Echinicola marina]UCS93371.1 GntR family transcriptional regulator [Echinicola marina]